MSPSDALYLATRANLPLYSIDPVTGLATAGPTLTNAPRPNDTFTALAFDDDGTLFGINKVKISKPPQPSDNDAFLVTIEPLTGQVTTIGQSVDGIHALAFQPVPEPGSLILAGLGAAALLGYAGSRRSRQPVVTS